MEARRHFKKHRRDNEYEVHKLIALYVSWNTLNGLKYFKD